MADGSKALSGAASGAAAGSVAGPWGAAIGGVVGGVAGLLGGSDNGAQDRLKAIQDLYAKIQDPNFDMSTLNPQEKALAGQLTPEAMQAMEMAGPATVSNNGAGRDAQMQALQSLQSMGAGGLNLQDKSDLQNIVNQQATANKGQQDAILANANARGVGGSGQSLAMQMMAQQGAANNAASQGTQVAANAQSRALQALQGAGQAGAQMQGADTGVSGQNAGIINAFNQANFANKQGIANQNVANRNAAQGFNLSNAQNINNSNVDTNNAFTQYNQQNQNNIRQQTFGNDLSKVNGQAGMSGNVANYMNANAAGQQSQRQGIGTALGTLAGAGMASAWGGKPTQDLFAGPDTNQDPTKQVG